MKRYSRKREAILDAIRSTTVHPSAEWVYMKLKPDFPDLSLATVYRNIAEFIEDGTVVSVGSVAGQERYDGRTEAHSHFICDNCGSVTDIFGFDTRIENGEIGDMLGALVTRQSLSFHGKCKNCL